MSSRSLNVLCMLLGNPAWLSRPGLHSLGALSILSISLPSVFLKQGMQTFVYLYFISRFGFKSGIRRLIAPVPVHCFSITSVVFVYPF